MSNDLKKLLEELVKPNLVVPTGVYSAIDPSLKVGMNTRGEYEYQGLDHTYKGPAETLLQVSALSGMRVREDEIARLLFKASTAVKHDPIAGYYLSTYAGWATHEETRMRASSGGITTWLLTTLLHSGEVDGVVHLKSGGKAGQLFSYQISRSEEEIRDGSKSRYYPGELSDVLQEIRSVPGKYALVGIPSFIYEVRLLQQVDPLFRDRIKFAIGLICGHQKSTRYAEYLAWQAGILPGDLVDIDFRKKDPNFPSNCYVTELKGVSKGSLETHVFRQDELNGTDWGLGYFKSRFSDFNDDAFNETADIVVGDAWLPRYVADSGGTNIIIVRNRELQALLAASATAGDLHLEDVSIQEVIDSQASLVRHSIEELPFRVRQQKARSCNFAVSPRRPQLNNLTFTRRLLQRSREAVSTMSHTYYEAARAKSDLQSFEKLMARLISRHRLYQLLDRISRKFRQGFRATAKAGVSRIARLPKSRRSS